MARRATNDELGAHHLHHNAFRDQIACAFVGAWDTDRGDSDVGRSISRSSARIIGARWRVGLWHVALVRVVAWSLAVCDGPTRERGIDIDQAQVPGRRLRVGSEGGSTRDPHGAPTTTFPLAWPCSR
jgi:hypothetical protein